MDEVAAIISKLERLGHTMSEIQNAMFYHHMQEQGRTPTFHLSLDLALDRHAELLEALQKELGIAV